MEIAWKKIDTLFNELDDKNVRKNIVFAEFDEDGLAMIDFHGTAKKIFDGKAMHTETSCQDATHWMDLGTLEAFLESLIIDKK